ncbi:MAG: hypothetical protein RL211_2183 [Pseudomonadota bacterium]|jgi:tRNA(fMet)-specific endonuclease VapC
MRYLLDTNICIYAIKGHAGVMAKLNGAGRDACAISTVALAELSYGIARSASPYKDRNMAALQEFVSLFQTVSWPAEAAWRLGPLRQQLALAGTPIDEFDLLIGSHALALGVTLVTNNIREFERIDGLKLENWAV